MDGTEHERCKQLILNMVTSMEATLKAIKELSIMSSNLVDTSNTEQGISDMIKGLEDKGEEGD